MPGDFYFKCYYQRLMASTSGWTDEEFGAYWRLLMSQFDKGGLPNNLDALNRIAFTAKQNWDILKSKFPVCDDGLLRNPVMAAEYDRSKTRKEKNRENGEKGGRPSKTQTKPNGSENQNQTVIFSETETKANGFKNNNPNESERLLKNEHSDVNPEKNNQTVSFLETETKANGYEKHNPNTPYPIMVNGIMDNVLLEKEIGGTEEKEKTREKFLVPEMFNAWKTAFPEYAGIETTDFPAIMEIIKLFCAIYRQGLNFDSQKFQNLVLDKWQSLIDFCKEDSHYSRYSISMLSDPKKLQAALQSQTRKIKSNGTKNTSSGYGPVHAGHVAGEGSY